MVDLVMGTVFESAPHCDLLFDDRQLSNLKVDRVGMGFVNL